MGKVLNFELEYREKGEKKILNLTIDFVSNWCIREFGEIFAGVATVKNSWDAISDLNAELAEAKALKEDGYKEKVSFIKERIKSETDAILTFSNNGFLERRFALVKQILIDNGVTDEKVLSPEFWDRNVDPAVMIEFLTACVYKDMDKKKAR